MCNFLSIQIFDIVSKNKESRDVVGGTAATERALLNSEHSNWMWNIYVSQGKNVPSGTGNIKFIRDREVHVDQHRANQIKYISVK